MNPLKDHNIVDPTILHVNGFWIFVTSFTKEAPVVIQFQDLEFYVIEISGQAKPFTFFRQIFNKEYRELFCKVKLSKLSKLASKSWKELSNIDRQFFKDFSMRINNEKNKRRSINNLSNINFYDHNSSSSKRKNDRKAIIRKEFKLPDEDKFFKATEAQEKEFIAELFENNTI